MIPKFLKKFGALMVKLTKNQFWALPKLRFRYRVSGYVVAQEHGRLSKYAL
ncbi:MAG: hypothetical protein GY820_22490 [Gammaproteobacteria bacterium]|nr:hypothetical protein [Gammaproteobacteria bacterium]